MMKTIGVMAVGVVLYVVASRLSPDALGMGIGLLMGLLAGIPTALIMLVVMHSNERSRERERERDRDRAEASYARLPPAAAPIIIVAGYGARRLEAEAYPQPQVAERGQFRLIGQSIDDDWR